MVCRHTVPDWARYVRDPDVGPPIFAACRLLVKEGEPAEEARAVACGYWGRQPQCPVYEGPGAPAVLPPPGARPGVLPPGPPARVAAVERPLTAREMAAARLTADGYAARGPLADEQRQRRRASAAALVLLAALGALAAWLMR